MDKEQFIRLIYKKLKDGLSSQESTSLDHWLNQSVDHQKIHQSLTQSWDLLEDYTPKFKVDADADYKKMLNQMHRSSTIQRPLLKTNERSS